MQNEMLTLVLQKYKRKVYIISYKVQYYNAVTYFWGRRGHFHAYFNLPLSHYTLLALQ